MPVTDDSDDYNDRLRRRMLMARIEAGLDNKIEDLRGRLVELGYDEGWSVGTLRAIASGVRAIRPDEIPVLAEACGVAPAFFHVDFAKLDEPGLRDDVSVLKKQVLDLQVDALQAAQAIEELQRRGRPEEPPGDDPR